MTPEDRHRLAIHEAGHAVAGVVLGHAIEYASIRPGRTFAGVAVPASRDRPGGDAFDPSRSALLAPLEFRADIERQIVALLAGDLAQLYLAEPQSGYMDATSEEVAAAALEALGSRIAELVTDLELREDPIDSDEDKARALARAFVGDDDGAAHYLAWLRCEARELVIRYRGAVLRVADALERYAVLRGDTIAALVINRPDPEGA